MKLRFYHVFFMQVALILLLPVFRESEIRAIFLNGLYTVVFLIIMYNLSRGVAKPLYLFMIGVPWIIFAWLSVVFVHILWVQLVSAFFMVLFFGYTTALIFQQIVKDKDVSSNTLFGAASIYMSLGLTWTGVYTLVELIHPLSFQISGDPGAKISRISELIYFSFTTLTTLGYGDISPKTTMAQSLAILEAMTGVLYMALIIGMLVGIYSSSSKSDTSK